MWPPSPEKRVSLRGATAIVVTVGAPPSEGVSRTSPTRDQRSHRLPPTRHHRPRELPQDQGNRSAARMEHRDDLHPCPE